MQVDLSPREDPQCQHWKCPQKGGGLTVMEVVVHEEVLV